MNQIKSEEFPKLKKILGNTNNLGIYPYKKVFIEVEPGELNYLYFILSECSQVIIIDKNSQVIKDTISVNDLVRNNFNYLKDAKTNTLTQLSEKYIFIIYEDLQELKTKATKYELRRKEVQAYIDFCNTFHLAPQRAKSINLYFESINKKIIKEN